VSCGQVLLASGFPQSVTKLVVPWKSSLLDIEDNYVVDCPGDVHGKCKSICMDEDEVLFSMAAKPKKWVNVFVKLNWRLPHQPKDTGILWLHILTTRSNFLTNFCMRFSFVKNKISYSFILHQVLIINHPPTPIYLCHLGIIREVKMFYLMLCLF
jgi:hypothetical protein